MEFINSKYNTVMIIEDNPIDLFIAKEIIKKNYFAKNIINFKCAFEAFKYFESMKDGNQLPDVIFLDLNLGKNSGWDFIELFLTLPKSIVNHIKLFVLTSSVDPRDIEKLKSFKINIGYKEKYIDKQFLDTI